MSRLEPRAKTYLVTALRNWAASLEPDSLNLSNQFKVQYKMEIPGGCKLEIHDPTLGTHVLDITVKLRRTHSAVENNLPA